jgi:hypothetical protein
MRAVVECLPYETKVAMLEGLDRYEIIAGAYSDRGGGVCPMLAAHRCGGRTDFRTFARAWDRFTGAGKARRANERELRTLSAQLEHGIWREEEARERVTRFETDPPRRRRSQAPGDPQPTCKAPFGAWLRPVRAWDEFRPALEAALRQLEQNTVEEDQPGPERREAVLEERVRS